MPLPHPFFLQILNHPENGLIMDQLPYIPGFDQIQAGHPLSQHGFRYFRTCIFKTIRIHREKQNARIQLTKLFHRAKVEKWIHRFAPLAPDLIHALLPLITTSCYCFAWPYAELWRLSDAAGERSIRLVRSFSFPYDRWVIVEPVLASLDAHMRARAITLPSREIPADAFTSHKPAWNVECVQSSPDLYRARLMREAFIERAFVVPLKGDAPRTVSHALVFYGQLPQRFTNSGPRRFVEYAAQYIKECYGKIEDIVEDEEDQVRDLSEERTLDGGKGVLAACMAPRKGPSQLHLRLRRSQSYVHNLANVNRGL